MRAKAKQGMRALVQAGFNMRKLRIVLDIHQKAVEGKLENVEQEAENLNKRVKEALQATIKILGDATKKAAKTLSEVTGNPHSVTVTTTAFQLCKRCSKRYVMNQILPGTNPTVRQGGFDLERRPRCLH